MTTAQPLQIPFTEFHETGNFIYSQTTKLPKFQENTQNIWNFQKNDVPLRVNKQNSQKTSHMPTLTWIGKEKVVNHHLDVPFRVLDRQYTFGDTPDSGNKIIHGDNLEALKALLPEYEGKIKCIYIDPPYNTGNEKWVYNDNVNDPHIRKWLGQVVGSEIDDLTRHDKWLCMMYPRLVLLSKLLAEDGVMFISIDDNEQANLKNICQSIFGNNIEQYIWCLQDKSESSFVKTAGLTVRKEHEYVIACFKKGNIRFKKYEGKREFADSIKDNPDNDPRGPWFSGNISRNGIKSTTGSKYYTIVNPAGESFTRNWTLTKEEYEEALRDNRIYFAKGGAGVPRLKIFPSNTSELIQSSLFTDVHTSITGKNELKSIFGEAPFQFPKPTTLIYRLMQLITDKDSIILDSFAGSGTTAHAVLNLNKQDGGNRKFILVELGDYAENITAERVRRVISGYGEGKNAVEGTGGSFDFYELGDTLFDPKTENLNDNANTEQIRQYVWYSETHAPYIAPTAEHHPYWLGTDQRTNYYFYYIKGEETCLSWDFLRTLTPERDKAEMYIIYADRCVLTESEMQQLNIRFKKIPRDIKRV